MSNAELAASALNESSIARELNVTLEKLLGAPALIEPAPEETDLAWSVLDPDTGDILGAGETVTEALADALRSVREWEPEAAAAWLASARRGK